MDIGAQRVYNCPADELAKNPTWIPVSMQRNSLKYSVHSYIKMLLPFIFPKLLRLKLQYFAFRNHCNARYSGPRKVIASPFPEELQNDLSLSQIVIQGCFSLPCSNYKMAARRSCE